jgi:hypothetical protein
MVATMSLSPPMSCPFASSTNVPTTVLAGRDDRFFPIDFQRRVAHERLGLGETPDGHLNAPASWRRLPARYSASKSARRPLAPDRPIRSADPVALRHVTGPG